MSAPSFELLASTSTTGFADGFGRRTLVFDRQCGTMIERLRLRPELAVFEPALRERIGRVSAFDDERFARVRDVERDPDSGALVVLSEFVAGERLSDLLEDAAVRGRDESAAPGIDVGIGYLLQVLPALSALHATAGVTHGALAPARTLLTATGQVVLTDYIYAQALQRLQFSRLRLWNEFGLALPQSAGSPRLDVAADLGQAALSALMLALGRPLRHGEYPNRLRAVLMEVAEIAQIRANAAFADNLRRLFERMLPLPGRRAFGSADEAGHELARVARSAMGVDACRTALPVFVAEMAAAAPAVADAIEATLVDAPRIDVPFEEPPQVVPIPIESPQVDPPFIAPVFDEAPSTMPEPVVIMEPRPLALVEPEPEPVAVVVPETPAASEPEPAPVVVVPEPEPLAARQPEPLAAPEPEPVAALEPEPQPEPEPARAPAAAAAPEPPPAPEPVPVVPADPAPPSPRRKRGRGVRDKLRSLRTPPPPPPAPPPAVVEPRPIAPAVAVPMPIPMPIAPPLPRPIPIEPASPYVQAVRAEAWQPSPVTSPLAPAAIALAPPAMPMAPVISKPQIGFAPAAPAPPSAPPAVRLKAEPPRGYTPKHEPRVRLDEPGTMAPHAPQGASRASRFPWKAAAAAVIVIAIGVIGGRAYLTDRPAGTERTAPAPVKASAPATVPAAVAPKTGTLVLETQPAGARVLLDGAAAGETPLTLSDVAAGRHVLTFMTASATVKRAVRVEAGKTLTLDVPVYSGWVAIFAPIVLHVSEGGKALGTTEQGRLMLSPGRHELTLSNRELGYAAVQRVEIEPGLEQTLNVDPRGAVNLNAVPWAEVFIDGQRAGETPIANLQVPLGTREFLFKHPQYGERRITTTVTGTAPVALSVDFTKSSRP